MHMSALSKSDNAWLKFLENRVKELQSIFDQHKDDFEQRIDLLETTMDVVWQQHADYPDFPKKQDRLEVERALMSKTETILVAQPIGAHEDALIFWKNLEASEPQLFEDFYAKVSED